MNGSRAIAHLFICLLLLDAAINFTAFPADAAALILAKDEGYVPLAGKMEMLQDDSGRLSIEDVSSARYSNLFKAIPGNLAAGFVRQGAIWLRCTVQRSEAAHDHWLLEVGPSTIEQIEFFQPDETGGFEKRSGGSLQHFSRREFPYRLELFRLKFPPDKPRTFYLRVASQRSLVVRPILWQADVLRQSTIPSSMFHGAYLGILILFAGISIIYGIRLKEPLYGYYSCYLVGLAIVFLEYYGYVHQYFVTDRTWLLAPFNLFGLILVIFSNADVCSGLVGLRQRLPRIDRVYRFCSYFVAALFTFLISVGLSHVIIASLHFVVLFVVFFPIVLCLFLAFRRQPGAVIYLIAFGPLVCSGTCMILTNLGLLPDSNAWDIYLFTSLAHVTILTFAVTNQITRIRQEKDQVDRALVTERRTVEQQRMFLRLISHELRTPLAIIDSTAQILPLIRCDQARFERKTNAIRETVRRLHHLLESCLTDDRLNMMALTPVMQRTDLLTLTREVVDRIQEGTNQHQLQFLLENLPVDFMCDPVLLEIMIGNLLENAVKYSPEGGAVTLCGRIGPEGELFLEIADNGVGIAPEYVDRIFDRFFRAGQVPGVSGAGLGLYLAQQIARLHGGTITCRTVPGRGSTFTVTLPAGGGQRIERTESGLVP